MIPVDALNLYAMGDVINPCLDGKLSERLKQMGRNMAAALNLPADEVQWMGDEEGICPVCHGNQITFRSGTTVECTVCGSIGEAVISDGQLKIVYPPEQILRSRYRPGGDMEHILEIKDMGAKAGKLFQTTNIGERIAEKMAELEDVPVREIRKGELI